MTVFTEGRHPGEGLLSEASRSRSRERATIPSGTGVVAPGTVLGRITGDGDVTVTVAQLGGGKGALTLATPAFGAGVKAGVYRIVFIEPASNAGTFAVEDPDGVTVGTGTVAVAFDGPIKFTIADGDPDFVAGDVINVTVAIAAGSGTYVPSPNALTEGAEGAEVAVAIALYGCDATSADQEVAIIARDAEWNGHTLTFDATVDDAPKRAAKVAQLSGSGIIVRY
jgi:hypothetical protein